MKITCDSCGAKYQVADEKVKNKVFKIRCKRCEHVIVVRGLEQAPESNDDVQSIVPNDGDLDATRQVSVPVHDESIAEGNQWHIVVNGQQVGPSTPEDIAGLLGRGEVDADAFVWREGMGDWAKLSSVSEFQHLFDEHASAQNEPAASARPFGGIGNSNVSDNDDVMASGNDAEPQGGGIFAAADASHASPRVSSGSQLAGQRNENSVLFSLDSLSDDAGVPQDVSNTGGTDGSGLIDISMLGTGGASGGGEDMFGGGGAMGPAPIAMPRAMPSLVMKRKSNTGLIVGLVLGGLLLAGGVGVGVYMAVNPKDKPAPTVASKKDTQTPVVVGQSPKNQATQKTNTASKTPAVAASTVLPGAAKPEGAAGPGTAAPTPGAAATPTPGATAAAVAPGTPVVPGQTGAVVAANSATTAAASATGTPSAAPAAAPAAAETPKAPPKVAAAPKPAPTKKRVRRKARRRKPVRKAAPQPKVARAAPPPAPPTPPPTPPPPAPKKAAKRSRGGDGLDDLLSNVGNPSAKKAAPSGASRSAATPAASSDALLPDKLGRRDVFSVIQRNAGAVARCGKEQGGEPGSRIKVEFFINGSNGRVSDARIRTPQFEGTGAGDCVVRVVRGFRFKRFKDNQMKISIPFRL